MSQATGISFHLNFRPWRSCFILTSIINWAHLKESNHHSSMAHDTWLILNKCLLNYNIMNWVTIIFKLKPWENLKKNEAFKLVGNYIAGLQFVITACLWQAAGHAAPKYGTVAYWIAQAERVSEMACVEKSFWSFLEASHKPSYERGPCRI